MSDYSYVSSKLGSVKPETRSISQEIFDAAAAAGHDIWFMWGYDGDASNTEHHSGLALDLMVRNSDAGTWIRNYVWANRARLRLRHVIWSQHITSTVTQPGVVRLMEDRGSVTNNHMDHVHVYLFEGAYQPPGGGTSTPAPSKSVDQIASEVIAGQWGNGDERVQKLQNAGYNASEVQAAVNRQLGASTPPPAPQKTVSQVAAEVILGEWGNGEERVRRLNGAGFDANAVQDEVNRQLNASAPPPHKSIAQIASEVIAGQWGNGDERVSRLSSSGYNASEVQDEVNRQLGASSSGPSVGEIAKQVIEGKWGNGPERIRRLNAAGYNPSAVQAEVNRRLR